MEFRIFCLELLVLFVFFFFLFVMSLTGSWQALEDGSPPREGGRELSLVLNPRPVQGPPRVTGAKDQGQRGNKSEYTLPTTKSLPGGEVC